MAAMSDALRARRVRVLDAAIARFAGPQVSMLDLWRAYQSQADDDASINSCGGFAKFVRRTGLATCKFLGQTMVLLPGRGPAPAPAPVAPVAIVDAPMPEPMAAVCPSASAAIGSGSPPVRVDTALMLHAVAEGVDALYEYAGRTEAYVLAELGEVLSRLYAGVDTKADRIRSLACALALNGREVAA